MWTFRKILSVCILLLFVSTGCMEEESSSITQGRFALSSSDIFSFENNPLLWTSWGNIGLATNASHGEQSLEITGCGWMEINSPVFATSQLVAVEDTIQFDLFIPTNQSNPWWIGDVGFLISIPSAGIYHQWFAQQLMNNLPRGSWVEAEVALPAHIKAALQGDPADVRLHLAVNTSSCAEHILIDNIRFAEEIVPENCFENDDCNDGEYCYFAECALETGICEATPEYCPTLWEPVCGCDGQTYDNACVAAIAGMSVDYEGECPPVNCWEDSDCGENQFCNFPGCLVETGICEDKPLNCTEYVVLPVCGCDGESYLNPCFAWYNGISIAHEGKCEI